MLAGFSYLTRYNAISLVPAAAVVAVFGLPAFDAGGKYIYFLTSTDYGPKTGWLEMSSLDRPVRRAIVYPPRRGVRVVLEHREPRPVPSTHQEAA